MASGQSIPQQDGLTIEDIREIQADAHKAISRQFRDEAEDNGWTPSETPQSSDQLAIQEMKAQIEAEEAENNNNKKGNK